VLPLRILLRRAFENFLAKAAHSILIQAKEKRVEALTLPPVALNISFNFIHLVKKKLIKLV